MVLLCAEGAYIAFCYSAVPITGNNFPVIGCSSLQARDMLAYNSAGGRRSDFADTAADERAPYEDYYGRNEHQAFSTTRGTGEDKAEEEEPDTGACEQRPRCLTGRSCVHDNRGAEIRVCRDAQFIANMVSVGVYGSFPLHIEGSFEIQLMVCRVFRLRLARRIIAPRSNSGAADLHGNNLLIRVIGRDIEAVAILTGRGRAGSCSTRSSRA